MTLVLVVAQQVLIHQIQTPDDPEFWNRYTLPLTFAPFFAAGLIIFRCPPPAWRWNWVAGLCVLALMLGFSFLTPVNLYLGGPAFVALMVLCAVAVALLYRSRLPAVVVPIAQFLGAISYSMYLTHWIAILVAQRAPAPLAVPVFVVGTLAIACLALAWSVLRVAGSHGVPKRIYGLAALQFHLPVLLPMPVMVGPASLSCRFHVA